MKSSLFVIFHFIVMASLGFPLAPSSASYPPLSETMTKAEQGDAAAQFYLGLMYENGHGLRRDDAEAVKWYRKAAEQGYAPAQADLAKMYRGGRGGLPHDEAEADKWYNKAAEQGNLLGKAALYIENLNRTSIFVSRIPIEYKNNILIALSILIIVGALVALCGFLTFYVIFVSSIFLKFKPLFSKSFAITTAYVACIIASKGVYSETPARFKLFVFLACSIGICALLSKNIEHPVNGPIGFRKGFLMFLGLAMVSFPILILDS